MFYIEEMICFFLKNELALVSGWKVVFEIME